MNQLDLLDDDEALPPMQPAPKAARGFAALDPAKRSAISSLGGRAAHALGTAHRFSSDEARVAGRKGGLAAHRSRGRRAS
jgi:general stress protein YciG